MFGIKILHSITVGNNISTKSHLSAQAGSQPVIAALDRKPVIIIVRTHHSQQSRFTDHPLERINMNHLNLVRRHLRIDAGHAFTPAFVVPVSDEMLSRGSHLIILLHPPHHFNAQFGYQIRRLPVHFFITSPPLVAPHIEYGCVNIGIPQHTGFPSGDNTDLADEFPIPGMS